ncbi:MAG: hypothetical protein KJ749_05330, partial [Planctomycetes bacterium]|nr:hypothetical protein [Planctomycetota bacterium]
TPTAVGAAMIASTFDGPSSAGETLHVVNLAFEVTRIDLPIHEVRHSRKIWNHADEMRVDADVAARLARNGVRMGAVGQDAWPAIHAILNAGHAKVRTDQVLAHSGLPVTLEVGVVSTSEAIFSYDHSSRLVGKTFTVGDKIVMLDYALDPAASGRVDVRVSLEVRHDRGIMTWEQNQDTFRQVPVCDRHVFGDLRVALTLNAGEALLIGPGMEAENEYLVGSRFFMGQTAGEQYEVLYCVNPVPYQQPGGRTQTGERNVE